MSNTRRVVVAVAVLAVVAGAVLWQRPGPRDDPRSEPSPRGAATPTPDPSPPTPTTAPCPDTTQTISVLTFNMHSGWHAGRLDLKATAQAIRASKADIVLIQEVDRFRINSNAVDQAAWLGRELDLHWAYGANDVRARAGPGLPRGAIGNAILSRFPLSQVDNTLLPAPGGLQTRGLLRAVADVNGVRLGVYVTHLDHTSPTVRIAQARRIRAALRRRELASASRGRSQRRARHARRERRPRRTASRHLGGGRDRRRTHRPCRRSAAARRLHPPQPGDHAACRRRPAVRALRPSRGCCTTRPARSVLLTVQASRRIVGA